ncbi:copper resistance CopC family protein [Plantactinospora sp. CA-290183]|uniref:copper resistance CopC family protein n=1 Tax=Plantactinospora sp. CA-290183 TaxID=3240006 RepID=UPI003D8B30A0
MSRLAAIAVCGTAVLAVPATPARAHGQLAVSDPPAGGTVSRARATLDLYYTEQPATNAHFTVTAPGGGRVDDGWSPGPSRRLDRPVTEYFLTDGTWEPRAYHTGYAALVKVAHWPATGRYTVDYLSVASDGEAVRGSLKFVYRGPVTPAPAGWSPPTNTADPALVAAAEGGGHTGTRPTGAATGAPAGTPAAAPAAPEDRGVAVWLLPALLLGAVVVMVVLAVRPRRRAAAGGGGGGAKDGRREPGLDRAAGPTASRTGTGGSRPARPKSGASRQRSRRGKTGR